MKNFLARTSIRNKIIFVAMVTGLAAILISNIANFIDDLDTLEDELQSRLITLSKVIADRSIAALEFEDTNRAQSNLSTLSAQNNIEFTCLYNEQGQVFVTEVFHQDIAPNCPEANFNVSVEFAEKIKMFYPVSVDELVIGALYIQANLDPLIDLRNRKLAFIAMIFLVIIPIAFLLSSWLKRIILEPILNLGNAISEIIDNGDYAIRTKRIYEDELGYLVSLFNNLLDKIQHEHRSLTESERKFRTMSQVSPVGVFQVDVNQNIIYFNENWSLITGITKRNAVLSEWIQTIHPDERALVQLTWDYLLRQEKPITQEFRVKHEENYIWVFLQATAIVSDDGHHTGYMAALSDINELKQAQIQLETLAFFDPLTGLANRRLFQDRLSQSIANSMRHDESLALLFLDLDQFKAINDTLGHDAGDLLLKTIASRLTACVRESDMVARIGGDEFTVILNNVQSTHDIQVVADKILKTLAEPIMIENQEIINTVSIGITVAPQDSTDLQALLKHADMAMYRAKERGRNNYQFFSKEMNQDLVESMAIEKDLRRSLKAKGHFKLLYQPKIDLVSGDFVGMEALIRWHHPERGVVPPNLFISKAEDSGLIVQLGNLVIEQACGDLKELIRHDLWPEKGKLAINLSPRQFAHPTLVEELNSVSKSFGDISSFLEVEITESMLMHDIEQAISTLKAIKNLGIEISIDDFGTGYSSLNYLKRFPIDVLKVDRSFVMDIPQDESDMAITAAVIAMAHKLNIRVVAEGVETNEQLKFLQSNDCEYGQGYLFSPPISLTEVREQLKRHQVFTV